MVRCRDRSRWANRSALLTPKRLANLAAWYRADQGITIATGVSQWSDLSGNGNHLLQATAGFQPAFSAAGGPNSKPCVTADGVDDFLRGLFTLGVAKTVLCVGKWNDVFSASSFLFDGAASNTAGFFRTAATTEGMFNGATLAIAAATPSAFHVHTAVFNGASSLYRQDAVQLAAGDTGAGSAGNGLCLFAFGSGASTWSSASIAEVIVYNRALSAAEIAQAEGYLHARYAL